MMHNTVVMACFGDRASREAIAQSAQTTEVIAVAFDLGGALSLGDIRDLAIAAGAVRCHALDVREEFAREVLVPASRSGLFADPAAAIPGLAAPLVAGKLQEIAATERASCVLPEHVHVIRRPLSRPPIDPLYVNIRFADGIPVAINGVEMALIELLDSLETITGEPALTVLQRAAGEPAGLAEPQPA